MRKLFLFLTLRTGFRFGLPDGDLFHDLGYAGIFSFYRFRVSVRVVGCLSLPNGVEDSYPACG